ncbi:DUF4870 family protein [Vibrio sp. E150_011]|uniref:DUF4870 family protein n=1 Tax=Vibrio sp. 10N.261.51.F12 TaxID=3229679 RepID=UPI0035509DC9
MTDTPVSPPPMGLNAAEQSAKNHAIIAYALMLLGFFTGISFLAGGIWGFVKKADAQNTRFYDHYENITKTFIISIVLSIVGAMTLVFVVGYFILIGVAIYTLFMLVKGLARVTSDKSFH